MDCEPSEGRVSIRPNCVIYRRCIEEGENDTMREIVLGSALEADQTTMRTVGGEAEKRCEAVPDCPHWKKGSEIRDRKSVV